MRGRRPHASASCSRGSTARESRAGWSSSAATWRRPSPSSSGAAFATTWDAELAALPEDWSDLYAEVELASSDYLDRAALLLAPVNPARYSSVAGFRFRVARRFGYGASAEMTHRCLERLDDERIHGRARVLWALSDTRPVQTQGPVWHSGGKSV